jgi:hypothetical protein
VKLLVEEEYKKEHKVFIGLKPRSQIYVEFKFVESLTLEALDGFSKLEAKAVGIPERIDANATKDFE